MVDATAHAETDTMSRYERSGHDRRCGEVCAAPQAGTGAVFWAADGNAVAASAGSTIPVPADGRPSDTGLGGRGRAANAEIIEHTGRDPVVGESQALA